MDDYPQNFKDSNERTDALASRKTFKRTAVVRDAFQEHGKLPPQAIDLEEAVLGALMQEKEAIISVAHILMPEVFYREPHQAIYSAIEKLYDANEPVDILTVTNALRNMGKLELVGGPFYITQLTSRVASSANVEFHSAVLKQKYMQRELIKISTETIRKSFEDSTDVFDLLDETESSIIGISEKTIGGNSMHVSTAVEAAMKEIAMTEALASQGRISGIPSGLKDLDAITHGWQDSELIVLAGRPGMGKTAFMLHCTKSASEAGKWVNVFSLEMDETKLAKRLILSCSSVEPDRVRNGNLTTYDWQELHRAESIVENMNIIIDPTPTATMRYIRSKSRLNKRKGQCDMVMIDYLQLIEPSGKDKLREQQVAECSRYCKILAKELKIPVILLAQLNREVEKSTDKKPQLSHLRESGAVEQDADMVLFLYRPEYYGFYDDAKGNDLRGVGKVIIAKYREGANTDIKFRYNKNLTQLSDFTKPSLREEFNELNYHTNDFEQNTNF